MSLSRRHLLRALPALLVAPLPALAGEPDPLLALIRLWLDQGRAVGECFKQPVPAVLVDPWLATEAAMVGVRPTTREGALAALGEVRDFVEGFIDDPMTRWLAEASHDFLREGRA